MILLKGLYDLGWGEPDANLYSPAKWAFVSLEQWRRYSRFELVYGVACCLIAAYLLRLARFVPETIKRRRQELEVDLFR